MLQVHKKIPLVENGKVWHPPASYLCHGKKGKDNKEAFEVLLETHERRRQGIATRNSKDLQEALIAAQEVQQTQVQQPLLAAQEVQLPRVQQTFLAPVQVVQQPQVQQPQVQPWHAAEEGGSSSSSSSDLQLDFGQPGIAAAYWSGYYAGQDSVSKLLLS